MSGTPGAAASFAEELSVAAARLAEEFSVGALERSFKSAPHLPQNFEVGGFSESHFAQISMSALPH
jgi:hypothetical protein